LSHVKNRLKSRKKLSHFFCGIFGGADKTRLFVDILDYTIMASQCSA
jgi:hypothetical protein